MKIFSKIISWIFHPLLMPTYGIILVMAYTYLAVFSSEVKLLLTGSTFVLTCIIPGLLIFLLIKQGVTTDVELTDRKERLVPYLIITVSLMITVFFMVKMMVPVWLTYAIIGSCFSSLAAMFINFYWKISAHTLAVGSLTGAAMGISLIHAMNPYWLFMALFVIGGLVGTSRIYMGKHTFLQVLGGFCLGLICTFVATMMRFISILIN